MTQRLLTIQEAADYLNMSEHKTRQIMDQIGATKKFGRAVRFDRVRIDNWFNEEGTDEIQNKA